jgi:hypothetical protein
MPPSCGVYVECGGSEHGRGHPQRVGSDHLLAGHWGASEENKMWQFEPKGPRCATGMDKRGVNGLQATR